MERGQEVRKTRQEGAAGDPHWVADPRSRRRCPQESERSPLCTSSLCVLDCVGSQDPWDKVVLENRVQLNLGGLCEDGSQVPSGTREVEGRRVRLGWQCFVEGWCVDGI